MSKTTKTGIELIKAAVILGVAANFILRAGPLGLNVLLSVLLLSAALLAITIRRAPGYWNHSTVALHGALLFFSAMFAVYDSPLLLFLDGVAIFAVLGILVFPALRFEFPTASIWNYVGAAAWSASSAIIGPFLVFASDINWSELPKNRVSKHAASLLRGLVFAVPVVFVVGALLMSADAVFESLVLSSFDFEAEFVFVHVFFSVLFSWLFLGYFRAAVFGITRPDEAVSVFEPDIKSPSFSVTEHTTEDPDKSKTDSKSGSKYESNRETGAQTTPFGIPEVLRFGVIETCVVLGLMNVVFLAFVIIQIPYLFGGMDLVQNTPDFKLAEYARRGVGELIDVSFLVLPVLLVVHWLLKKDKPINQRVFRVLAGTQVVLLFVILISASQRLSLLTGSLGYGMTEFRFYAYFLLILLAMIFLWFGATVLRGMRKNFAYGAFWSVLFVLASLNFVNPDARIVKHNTDLLKQGRDFDTAYNTGLSADALPDLIGALEFLKNGEQEMITNELNYVRCDLEKSADLRTWNWSRSNALSAIRKKGINCGK